MTAKEKNLVTAVFGELVKMDDNALCALLGSITAEEVKKMYNKLKYEPYCTRHGISYEEMTDLDFEQAYRDEWEA